MVKAGEVEFSDLELSSIVEWYCERTHQLFGAYGDDLKLVLEIIEYNLQYGEVDKKSLEYLSDDVKKLYNLVWRMFSGQKTGTQKTLP